MADPTRKLHNAGEEISCRHCGNLVIAGIGYYYVTAETARAALAVVPVPEWQPIETAPRDGRLLLCASMTNQLHGYYDRAVLRYISELQGWSCPGLSGLSPTHWQPLPAPPERAGK